MHKFRQRKFQSINSLGIHIGIFHVFLFMSSRAAFVRGLNKFHINMSCIFVSDCTNVQRKFIASTRITSHVYTVTTNTMLFLRTQKLRYTYTSKLTMLNLRSTHYVIVTGTSTMLFLRVFACVLGPFFVCCYCGISPIILVEFPCR